MARPTLGAIRQQADFQKTYFWEMGIGGANAALVGALGGAGANLLCTTTEIPRYEGETALQMIKGYQIPDPGIYKPVSKMTISFVEMVDSRIRTGWDNWMAAMRNKDRPFLGLFCDLFLRTTNNQGDINYEYNLKWCFPDATDPQELDSDNSNPMKFKVTLRYSDVRITQVALDRNEQKG